jgi:hypothetical protein
VAVSDVESATPVPLRQLAGRSHRRPVLPRALERCGLVDVATEFAEIRGESLAAVMARRRPNGESRVTPS